MDIKRGEEHTGTRAGRQTDGRMETERDAEIKWLVKKKKV
jgi:hypothetical protein